MATTTQQQIIIEKMVEFQDRFLTLPDEDARWLIQNPSEAIDLIIAAIINRCQIVPTEVDLILGEIIKTVVIPATIKKFVVKDHFKVDVSRRAKVKISCLGDYFKSWFMEKREEPHVGSTVYGRRINKSSVDDPLISELGGQEKAETSMFEIYAMMECQPNGEAGDLLNNGCANIFYVRDVNSALRVVAVDWDGNGWYVDALLVEFPVEWDEGGLVFSHNSLSLAPQNV